ncbi:hypothetical protein Ddye_023160 [Dipteronia dyeriana]|uniref:Uncharacterized protein n=1 Tax=Dipteronia dyeriana TaxID=168575 RepID=A0AAD9TSW8_9ROSI|nr:hypothetical protein Ddye_023160 [Dipteronia dyeriana]
MWFGVGNRAVRFGKEEFLIFTGLRFRPMPQSVNSLPKAVPGIVYHRYFGGSPTFFNDILGRLSGEEFDEPEDVIKLGYVYFLSHILLGREYRCFHLLLFQYWAMKAIPVLTGLDRKRRRGRTGRGFPRLTKWYCRKKPAHLGNKFNDKESSLRRDDLGDMNDAHEIGDDQHDAHEDEVGDDQHDEAADEEDDMDKGAAKQDAPQQDEVNCVGQEQNRRRSKRLRKGATSI